MPTKAREQIGSHATTPALVAKSYANAAELTTDVDLLTDGGGVPPSRIRVGGIGNLDLILMDDTAVTIAGCIAGEVFSLNAKTIKETSTATKITCFWS